MNNDLTLSGNKEIPADLISLPAEIFEHDLQIADRYLSFSAELLRLSLLAIAGVGFFTTNLLLKSPNVSAQVYVSRGIKVCLYVSLFFLGVSVLSALANRYLIIDSTRNHLEYARLYLKLQADDHAEVKEILWWRDTHYKCAYWILWGAAATLFLGTAFLAIALVIGLWMLP